MVATTSFSVPGMPDAEAGHYQEEHQQTYHQYVQAMKFTDECFHGPD